MSDIFGGPPDDQEFDPEGYPEDYAETEDPFNFFRGDIPSIDWYDRVDIEDYTLTSQQWHDLVIQDVLTPGIAEQLYGMDGIDIIYELEDAGYWDSDDWEVFREYYGEQ